MKKFLTVFDVQKSDCFIFTLAFFASFMWSVYYEPPSYLTWRPFGSQIHEVKVGNISGSFGTHRHKSRGGRMLSDVISSKVKVLCMIFTHEKNYPKAVTVNMTWSQRCTKHVFISSKQVGELPTIKVDVVDEWKYLWNKTRESFKWAYHNELDNFDWFIKADDDTYVIVENMKYLLSFYDPNEPWYFGCRFSPYVKKGYMSGGAGYILSKKAVTLLVENGLRNSNYCDQGMTGPEDVNMGKCLENVGVFFGDSRDELNRWRFFPFKLSSFFTYNDIPKNMWYWDYIYYNITLDMNCCSHTAISAHYIDSNKMLLYNYLLYHVQLPFQKKFIKYLPSKVFQ